MALNLLKNTINRKTMVNFSADANVDAEYSPLHLPSHFGHDWCNENAAEDLAEAELCLRE